MCLAVVGTVTELNGNIAIADVQGNQLKVITTMVPKVKIGDHVLVHAGFAISIVSPDDYQQHQAVMKEVADHARQALDEN